MLIVAENGTRLLHLDADLPDLILKEVVPEFKKSQSARDIVHLARAIHRRRFAAGRAVNIRDIQNSVRNKFLGEDGKFDRERFEMAFANMDALGVKVYYFVVVNRDSRGFITKSIHISFRPEYMDIDITGSPNEAAIPKGRPLRLLLESGLL